MKVIETEKKPIKLWIEHIEDGALSQAKNLANLPFIFKHIAIMPDCHQGYGMPIGAVMATRDVVIPNAVGVDIGCGMCALKTNLTDIQAAQLKQIIGGIRSYIPTGFKHHTAKQEKSLMPFSSFLDMKTCIVELEYENALKQIGTLGGGNHFIEIQKGSDGYIWFMVHSGSRNIGFKVAQFYNKLAVDLNKRWHTSVPKKWELAFLPLDSEYGKNYIREMNYCVDFALASRCLMAERIKQCFYKIFPDVEFGGFVNIAHNYATTEHHFGKNVMVHRKGATRAYQGEYGIIPGSQGTKSYIVKGKGEPQSFMSCSHGAGRKMGRKEARRTLDLSIEQDILDKQSIIHSIRNEKDLDEATGAYKNIDDVMAQQKNLIEIDVELTPIAVVKG